jgi:hypothetical protein
MFEIATYLMFSFARSMRLVYSTGKKRMVHAENIRRQKSISEFLGGKHYDER